VIVIKSLFFVYSKRSFHQIYREILGIWETQGPFGKCAGSITLTPTNQVMRQNTYSKGMATRIRVKRGAEAVSYSSQEYWETRYQKVQGFHEWYCSYDNLKPLLEQKISLNHSVLEIGCGDSPLLPGLLEAGHTGLLHGIDFSKSIILKLIDDQTKKSELCVTAEYLEMDARHLKYEDDSWDVVLDKGTLDAMLCDKETGLVNARELTEEACRVLKKSSGVMVFISHIQVETPEFDDWMQNCILPVLDDHRSYLWKIEAHVGSADNPRGDSESESESHSPTVYIISSRPRKFTRGCLSSGVVEMKVLSHAEDDDDVVEEEEEENDAETVGDKQQMKKSR
jgi:ubiquinone/menaquinone biosynthesis C-methylase UbiE